MRQQHVALAAPVVAPQPSAMSSAPGSAVYDYLRNDGTSLSLQTIDAIEGVSIRVRPRFIAYAGKRPFLTLMLVVLLPIGLVVFARIKSTSITIDRGRLQIRKGLLARRLTNIDLWRVTSIELERSLINRLTGDGTLVLSLAHSEPVKLTGLVADPRLEDTYQRLLNVVFLLRSNPLVKGIIQ